MMTTTTAMSQRRNGMRQIEIKSMGFLFHNAAIKLTANDFQIILQSCSDVQRCIEQMANIKPRLLLSPLYTVIYYFVCILCYHNPDRCLPFSCSPLNLSLSLCPALFRSVYVLRTTQHIVLGFMFRIFRFSQSVSILFSHRFIMSVLR